MIREIPKYTPDDFSRSLKVLRGVRTYGPPQNGYSASYESLREAMKLALQASEFLDTLGPEKLNALGELTREAAIRGDVTGTLNHNLVSKALEEKGAFTQDDIKYAFKIIGAFAPISQWKTRVNAVRRFKLPLDEELRAFDDILTSPKVSQSGGEK